MGDFSTKGEPREAAVAISMLESGNWVLPQTYADEFAFKPPMRYVGRIGLLCGGICLEPLTSDIYILHIYLIFKS